MNAKLEAALAYSRMRWRIFPCHSVANGRCTCGKNDCKSPAKHPRTKGGFKDATDDPNQIRRWWTRWPDANIGLATGSGLAVFDLDGPEGMAEFKALVAKHGAVPETLVQQTGRGFHLVFATRAGAGEVRSSAMGKVHVRGEGGYILVAPSDHISGRKYQWVKKARLAILPDWLRQWSQGYEISTNYFGLGSVLGRIPDYLQRDKSNTSQRDIGASLTKSLRTEWSAAEQARLISALAAIPADNYETWYQVGMALQQLGWEGNGTDLGFEIWDQWSATCPAKYSVTACHEKWQAIARGTRGEITLGTIYHWARQRGWNGGAPDPIGAPPVSGPDGGGLGPPKALNGHHTGPQALPAAFLAGPQAIFFPDLTEKGHPRATMLNAKVACQALQLDCRYDLFHNRLLVAGELLGKWNSAELSDYITAIVRDIIRYRFGFDPGKTNTQDACETLCLARRFDPILDYLAGLQWDGTRRLDRWLTTYMGAADTDLNRAIGRLSLIAAVRRARHPGTKFDQIVVLEGPQGQGKSEAIEILAGPENFSDQSILGVDDRKQQELTEGVWLYEIGELSGLKRAEIEHVKQFASRKVDRARPAYGRYSVSQPRRTIFFASTNQEIYLQDDTGNRRFWPARCGAIDHAGLKRDRDQLWAEAAHREAQGEPHMLPESLWAAAHEEQEKRRQSDSWLELINNYVNMSDKTRDDVSVTDVLCDNQFIQMRPDQVKAGDAIKAGRILSQLKFVRYQKRTESGARIWRYRRESGAQGFVTLT